MAVSDKVEFQIHGKKYTVGGELTSGTTLNDYIRDYAHQKGTKYMCREGGCGACIVTVKRTDPVTKKESVFAVNSCLVSVYACDGWDITTTEGLGNKTSGYNKLQTTLASFNGSQCGFCSPGMVMSMNSMLEAKGGKITVQDVENTLSGNICRCTGYRPILNAFQSMATDAPQQLKQKLTDIEELTKYLCKQSGKVCSGTCGEPCSKSNKKLSSKSISIKLKDGTTWHKVYKLEQILEIFKSVGIKETYMLVAGNTAHGVYHDGFEGNIYIDINEITELREFKEHHDRLVLGANITLADAITIFRRASTYNPNNFGYLTDIADHIELVANVSVRNIGTLAGNLSIKHAFNEFPSDIFLTFTAARAHLIIVDKRGSETTYALEEYLKLDMKFKVIRSIVFPTYNSSHYIYRSFKIMKRSLNTPAYVNAAFRFKVDKNQGYKVLEQPSIIFGGISPTFIHASAAEKHLINKSLLDAESLKSTLKILNTEIQPNKAPTSGSPQYRQLLAVSLFYKFVLGLNPSKISSKNKSGATLLSRPVATGTEDAGTDKDEWPITQPLPKIEALIQCAGEAEYVNDIPRYPSEVYANFVTCDKGPAELISIDASEALKIPGVIAFLSAKDIPGTNLAFLLPGQAVDNEEFLVSKKVPFGGANVGIIVAETFELVVKAAAKVKVNVKMTGKPELDVRKIVTSGQSSRIRPTQQIKAKTKKTDIKHQIKGSFLTRGQYHYHMELQSCLAVPTDIGLDVYTACQFITLSQTSISQLLSLPQNEINVEVKRIGGGFGGKFSNAVKVSDGCALAAHVLKLPVRMILPMEQCTGSLGKRSPYYGEYDVSVNDKGEIQTMQFNNYSDTGFAQNEPVLRYLETSSQNSYDVDTWDINISTVYTDTCSNTVCRAPGAMETTAILENIMDRIAVVTNQNPIDVRIANLKPRDKAAVTNMTEEIKRTSDYDKRKISVETFNKENRWKKRGIELTYMNFLFEYDGPFHLILSAFAPDGTVAITHGGTEMGQGLNTKAVQVIARKLGIDMSLIKVKPNVSLTSPNDAFSGGDTVSTGVCYAAIQSCDILLERLKPYRTSPTMSWSEVISAAYAAKADLCVEYMYSPNNIPGLSNFPTYGIVVSEVEVDVLTGQVQILRVDILEDAGNSINPQIDVGQVQGAFIMGLGIWLTEQLIYDEDTGALLTNRSWNYTPPMDKDIPIDFRVQLRRNAPNPLGVLRSKAAGEPPLCLAVSIGFAIRNALLSARNDAGSKEKWFDMDMPYTPENNLLNSMSTIDQYTL